MPLRLAVNALIASISSLGVQTDGHKRGTFSGALADDSSKRFSFGYGRLGRSCCLGDALERFVPTSPLRRFKLARFGRGKR